MTAWDIILLIIGWAGSAFVVWSLMLANVLKFRWMNFTGAALATFYNAWLGVWPFAAMNAAITVIDAYWLWKLYRESETSSNYDVLEVRADDAFLGRVLDIHSGDIAKEQPTFDRAALVPAADRSVWMVVRSDEPVGVLAVHAQGKDAVVELDYVTQRFRDFQPGKFVHEDSGIFEAKGFTRVVVHSPPPGYRGYLEKVGFAPLAGDVGTWVREVGAPAGARA